MFRMLSLLQSISRLHTPSLSFPASFPSFLHSTTSQSFPTYLTIRFFSPASEFTCSPTHIITSPVYARITLPPSFCSKLSSFLLIVFFTLSLRTFLPSLLRDILASFTLPSSAHYPTYFPPSHLTASPTLLHTSSLSPSFPPSRAPLRSLGQCLHSGGPDGAPSFPLSHGNPLP